MATLMNQSEYSRHRKRSRQYINQLKTAGMLIFRGKLVDVAASDAVLDGHTVEIEQPQTAAQFPPAAGQQPTGQQPTGQQPSAPTSYATARTADMVFRAKNRKLDFD